MSFVNDDGEDGDTNCDSEQKVQSPPTSHGPLSAAPISGGRIGVLMPNPDGMRNRLHTYQLLQNDRLDTGIATY